MKNYHDKIVFLGLLAVLGLCAGVSALYLSNKSHNAEENVLVSDKPAIVRILAQKERADEGYTLYSIDVADTTKQLNLTELLDLPIYYGTVVANDGGNKIAYVKTTDAEVSLWKASTDGSGATRVFHTNNTGCNQVRILGVSADGRGVLFAYNPYVEGEVYTCEQLEAPLMVDEGLYYIQDGSTSLTKIQNFGERFFLGFNENDILFSEDNAEYNNFNYNVKAVWVMDTQTTESKKLFDIPQSLLGGNFLGIHVVPNAGKAVIEVSGLGSGDPMGVVKMLVFDYKNNTLETIASGEWAEYQGVKVSPNFEKVVYVHELHKSGEMPKTNYFVYDVKTKQHQALMFPEKGDTGWMYLVWKNDTSFFYVFNPAAGYEKVEDLRLFDLTNFSIGESIGKFINIL